MDSVGKLEYLFGILSTISSIVVFIFVIMTLNILMNPPRGGLGTAFALIGLLLAFIIFGGLLSLAGIVFGFISFIIACKRNTRGIRKLLFLNGIIYSVILVIFIISSVISIGKYSIQTEYIIALGLLIIIPTAYFIMAKKLSQTKKKHQVTLYDF